MVDSKKTCTVVWPSQPDPQILELTEGESLTIGRRPPDDGSRALTIPLSDVSGLHAEIKFSDSGWIIVDLGSSNGTKVKEQALQPAVPCVLHPGDRISIAGHDVFAFPKFSTIRPDRAQGLLVQEQVKSMIMVEATIMVAVLPKSDKPGSDSESNGAELTLNQRIKLFNFINREIMNTFGHLDRFDTDMIVAWWNTGSNYGLPNPGVYNACQIALALKSYISENQSKEFKPGFALDTTIATGEAAGGKFGELLFEDPMTLAFQMDKSTEGIVAGDIVVDDVTHRYTKDNFKFEELSDATVIGAKLPAGVFKLVRARSKR